MTDAKHYRLRGDIQLLSPMSHIGESLGVDSYLAETKIIGPDGQPVECFAYSGNAFRGQLRDLGAKYLLWRLGDPKLNLESFHLLFSGGSIGGDQHVDIDQARLMRRLLPFLSIFGGGVGQQILAGKLKIGAMWPRCRETQHLLPAEMRSNDAPGYGELTAEHSFTRTDDAKNEQLREDYLALPPTEERLALDGDAPKAKGKKAEKDGPAQQMRYTVEVMAAGTRFYQRIDLLDMSELEVGAFVSCLSEFSRAPYVGGKSGIGFGLVDASWEFCRPGEDSDWRPFASANQDLFLPGAEAKSALAAYNAYVLEIYNAYLENKSAELRKVLAIGAGHAGA